MKRKTIILMGIVMTAILVLSVTASAVLSPVAPQAKDKAAAAPPDNSPVIDENSELTPPGLEKIVFIHYKKGFGKPYCNNDGICEPGENWKNCPNDCTKGGEEEEPTTTCYAFLGKYGKRLLEWRTLPVNYVINSTNPDGLSETFVTSAISAGAEEWDANTGADLFNDIYDIGDTKAGVQDYINTLAWGDYPEVGVIAVAIVWYNPATKTIVEFDVMFDTDYAWGDATSDSAVMDLQNIATHEIGHGLGLDDVYDSACSEVTMYGYSTEGETKKRALEPSDITGIQELYGA